MLYIEHLHVFSYCVLDYCSLVYLIVRLYPRLLAYDIYNTYLVKLNGNRNRIW